MPTRPRRPLLSLLLLVAGIALLTPATAQAFLFYGSGSSALGRAETDGTGVRNALYTTPTNNPNGVAANAEHVFWTSSSTGRVHRAPVDGSGPVLDVVTGLAFPSGLALSATHLYIADQTLGTISRTDLDGTGRVTLLSGLPSVDEVEVNATHLFWGRYSDGDIGRANLDGTDPRPTFITGGATVYGIALNATHLFWTNLGRTTIGRAALDGTGVDQSFITGAATPAKIEVDATHVFWTNYGSSIGRAALDGTDVRQAFVTGANQPRGLALQGGTAASPTTTSLVCTPASVAVGGRSTCTATVRDAGAGAATTPTGEVALTTDASGSFAAGCTLVAVDASTASCATTYTPSAVGDGTHAIGAAFPGATGLAASSGGQDVAVSRRSSAVAVACVPSAPTLGIPSSCTATVEDAGDGASAPTGVVAFATTPDGSGAFSSASCTLVGDGATTARCSVAYTPLRAGGDDQVVTAGYGGDAAHLPGTATTTLSVGRRGSGTSVSCTPGVLPAGTTTSCSIRVEDGEDGLRGDPTGVVSLEVVTTEGGAAVAVGTCALEAAEAGAACSVPYTPGRVAGGTHIVTARYGGDAAHAPSSATTRLGVGPRATTTTVSCTPSPVTAGTRGTCTGTVRDAEAGAASVPQGSLLVGAERCTLVSGSCSVPSAPASGTELRVGAVYDGTDPHAAGEGTTVVQVAPAVSDRAPLTASEVASATAGSPLLTGLRLSRRCLRGVTVRRTPSRAAGGLRVSFSLSRPATVRYVIRRRVASKPFGSCPKVRGASSSPFTTTAVRTEARPGGATSTSLATAVPRRFSALAPGRTVRARSAQVPGTKVLRPGTYVLQVLVPTAGGGAVPVAKVKFWVLRP